MLDGPGDPEIGDARLNDDRPVLIVDVEHPVELHHGQQNAVGKRQRAAGERRPGTARHHLDVVLVAIAQDTGDLVHGFGKDHDQRQLIMGLQEIGFIGAHFGFVIDYALSGHNRLQRFDDVRPAGDDRAIRRRHCDRSHGLSLSISEQI